jgi:hypothetical protein
VEVVALRKGKELEGQRRQVDESPEKYDPRGHSARVSGNENWTIVIGEPAKDSIEPVRFSTQKEPGRPERSVLNCRASVLRSTVIEEN